MKSRFSLKQFLTFVFIFFVGILLLCLHHATPNATKKQSVSYTQTEFIEEIAPTIQKVAASYGVRTSIIIAQAVLESNYGTNLLAVKYHNLFAVQAQDGQMSIELTYKSYFVNEWQTETGCFAVYKSWLACKISFRTFKSAACTWIFQRLFADPSLCQILHKNQHNRCKI